MGKFIKVAQIARPQGDNYLNLLFHKLLKIKCITYKNKMIYNF